MQTSCSPRAHSNLQDGGRSDCDFLAAKYLLSACLAVHGHPDGAVSRLSPCQLDERGRLHGASEGNGNAQTSVNRKCSASSSLGDPHHSSRRPQDHAKAARRSSSAGQLVSDVLEESQSRCPFDRGLSNVLLLQANESAPRGLAQGAHCSRPKNRPADAGTSGGL